MGDQPIRLTSRGEITRRDVLRAFAAGVAAIEVGCLQRPGEEIRPAVNTPETAPGVPRYFATSIVEGGFATGVLVEAHGGRPTKIEGNPAHPASLGATTAQHQASILDLYDPYRLRAPRERDLPASWNRVQAALAAPVAGDTWIVLPPESSPSIAALLDRVREVRERVHVAHYAAIDHRVAYRGTQLAFGAELEQQLALDRAETIVAFDADVLATMPMAVRRARDFAGRRRRVEPGDHPPRLFVAEPMFTPTGGLADHRLAVRASDVAAVVIALAGELAIILPRELRDPAAARVAAIGARAWVAATARSLRRSQRASAIVVGDRQSAAVHALAHRISFALGAIGHTTTFIAPVLQPGDRSIDELAGAIRGNQVGALIAIDTGPLPSLDRALVRSVPLTVHATLRPDELSAACRWVVPLSHYLETWGDARAGDGTASPIQPLIQPLHASRSAIEVLAMLAGEPADARAIVRAYWQRQLVTDEGWHAALSEGVFAGSATPRTVAVVDAAPMIAALAGSLDGNPDRLEVALARSPTIGDGRFSGNPWLQELPHPYTKQTWGNAALLGAATAKQLGVGDGDVLRLVAGDRSLDAPALVVPGHADGAITLELGYGRRMPEVPIADGHGVDGLALTGGPLIAPVTAARTGERESLARTQQHFGQHDRPIAPHVDLAYYRAHPEMTADLRGPLPTLHEAPPPRGPQWGMTIDTTICTGCSACVIACQAENNVPVVGAAGVRKNREMHWLRIDTYVEETPHGTSIVHQPMACQHCEHAPCEYVCPTFATVHGPDGLNEMVYNRCVGTRFCSNNCPYKVRRFNWFGFDEPVTLRALQHNPDVTVRSRGVMEKCTYCVQRIRAAEIAGRLEQRAIRSGEVVTACQAACPTTAIHFGELADPESVRLRALPRSYAVLHDLGTRPRTIYLAKIRNPEDA